MMPVETNQGEERFSEDGSFWQGGLFAGKLELLGRNRISFRSVLNRPLIQLSTVAMVIKELKCKMLDTNRSEYEPSLPQRRRPRWSLRGMVVLLAVVGMVCAFWSSGRYTSREASLARRLKGEGYTVLTGRLASRGFNLTMPNEDDVYISGICLDIPRYRGQILGGRVPLLGSVALESMQRCRHLSYLGLANSDVDTDAILAMRSPLQCLDLTGTDVDDQLLIALEERANQFDLLRIADTKISDEGLRHWSHCRSLTEFAVGGDKVTDDGIQQLRHCDSLIRFAVNGPNITGTFLQDLGSLEFLEKVSIDDCPKFDLENLKYLGGPRVRELDIACKPANLPIKFFQQSRIVMITIRWDAPLDEEDRQAITALKAPQNTCYVKSGLRHVNIQPTK